jgi:uncharacterized membrane protein
VKHDRDPTIDTLRGIAILTMVASNLAAVVLIEPHPLWLRAYGSFAAPLFVLISGMMVALTARSKGYDLVHFLTRGGVIIVVAALVDVLIWQIYPFTSVDVLYLIAISTPLAYLSFRLKDEFQWVIVGIILLGTPVLQGLLGYAAYPTEISLADPLLTIAARDRIMNILGHWLIDGWFPIFPWLGLSLMGVLFASLRYGKATLTIFWTRVAPTLGGAILLIGILVWSAYPGRLLVREGYSELFYPPTLGYVLTAVGLILVLFWIVDRWPAAYWRPIKTIGQSALLIYVLHLALIETLISSRWGEVSMDSFLLLYVSLSLFLILIAYGLRRAKSRWEIRPFLLRVLLGA